MNIFTADENAVLFPMAIVLAPFFWVMWRLKGSYVERSLKNLAANIPSVVIFFAGLGLGCYLNPS